MSGDPTATSPSGPSDPGGPSGGTADPTITATGSGKAGGGSSSPRFWREFRRVVRRLLDGRFREAWNTLTQSLDRNPWPWIFAGVTAALAWREWRDRS